MDCYICNPETNDSGECETCRYALYPMQEYMREVTGDPSFTEHGALSAVNKSDEDRINAWCAGAQLPFRVVRLGGNYQVARCSKPASNFVTEAEMDLLSCRARISKLEAENQRLREAAKAVISERNYVRGDTALEFLIDKLESALLGGGDE